MEAGWFHRMRWRRRGAWLWPAFVALIAVNAAVGHTLPPVGESQTWLGGALTGCILTLIALILLTRPLGALLRRLRPDLPKVVARNYAGTALVLSVTAGLTVAGLAHRPALLEHQRTMHEAISRAQAWIGYRAPAAFRRNINLVSAFAIEPGSIYRMCVPDDGRQRNYCVIVKTHLPFAQSVTFAGTESNSVFAAGAG